MSTETTTIKSKVEYLTKDQRLNLGSRIAEKLKEIKGKEREKKAAAARFKAEEEDLQVQLGNLCEQHDKGYVEREYKCNVLRDGTTGTVNFVVADYEAEDKEEREYQPGDILDSRSFNRDDWTAYQNETQIPLDLHSTGNPSAPDENDLRAQANLTTPGEIEPDRDENKDVVAGPNTDAYNRANPGDDSYQHLSGDAHFAPVIPMYQQEAGAEQTDAADVDKSDMEDDDEPTEDDEPGDDTPPAPNPPKRKARRKGDPKE